MSSIEAIGHADPADLARPPAARRSRSPSGSAGRRRPTGRSGPARAGSGSARSSRPRVEKPAYWRIVQSRPRYIVGWTPRVNGNSPGRPEVARPRRGRPCPRACRGRRSRCPRWSGSRSRRSASASLRARRARVVSRQRSRPGSHCGHRLSLTVSERRPRCSTPLGRRADRGSRSTVPARGRADLVLHLHRLDGQQPLPGLDGITHRDPDADDPARDRRPDDLGAAGVAAATALPARARSRRSARCGRLGADAR